MGDGNKSIPDRWLDYSTLGRQIPRTRIVCFKVPLKMEICNSLPEKQRFTPDMLIKALPNLVGVIDVTNTPRYYDKQEFMKHGIHHEKILCPGHKVPPLNVINKFQNVMDNLWNVADSLDKLVGVHCTHGVNRTGYLVCRYLIECRGFQPDEAVILFGESRGHPIERQNYLNDLMTLKSKKASKRTSHRGEMQSGFQNKGMDAHAESRQQRNFPREQQNLYQHTGHPYACNFPDNLRCPENRHTDFYPPMNSRDAHLYDSRGYPIENASTDFYPPMNSRDAHLYDSRGYPIENACNHPPQSYASSRSPQSYHPEQDWNRHSSRNHGFQPLQSHQQFSSGKSYYQN